MITLAEAKLHCRIDHSEEDELIQWLIDSAISVVEDRTGRALVERETSLVIDEFTPVIELPEAPVISVTAVSYTDENGLTVDFTDYWADLRRLKARLMPAHGSEWPKVPRRQGGISITYRVGYATVPKPLRQAALLLIGTFYEHRESVADTQHFVIPGTVKMLIEPYRILKVA